MPSAPSVRSRRIDPSRMKPSVKRLIDMVDKVMAWVESKMETTLHRPLEPKDRVKAMRMLAVIEPEPRG